jgi:hypothetical protein
LVGGEAPLLLATKIVEKGEGAAVTFVTFEGVELPAFNSANDTHQLTVAVTMPSLNNDSSATDGEPQP